MFKKEFKNGVIILKASGMNRRNVFLANSDKSKEVLLEGAFDWGWHCNSSNLLAQEVLKNVIEEKFYQQIKPFINNFERIIICSLNSSLFDVKIHIGDFLHCMGLVSIELSNKSKAEAIKHAYSFMQINISKSEEDCYVSKFLDFPNISSVNTLYPVGSVQNWLYKNFIVEDGYFSVFEKYLQADKKILTIGGSFEKINTNIEVLEYDNLLVTNGFSSEEEANKCIFSYDKIYLSIFNC